MIQTIKNWIKGLTNPKEQGLSDIPSDFVEQFTHASHIMNPIQDEFDRCALFSEHSFDLFIRGCKELYDADVEVNIQRTLLGKMWLKIAREAHTDNAGVASVEDFLKTSKQWHYKLIGRLSNSDEHPSRYFLYAFTIDQSFMYAVELIQLLSKATETPDV